MLEAKGSAACVSITSALSPAVISSFDSSCQHAVVTPELKSIQAYTKRWLSLKKQMKVCWCHQAQSSLETTDNAGAETCKAEG